MIDTGVVVAATEAERADALAVRHAVFVEGQGISEDRELDGLDSNATHVVAYDDGEPIGAARLRQPESDLGKVERVAVREDRRGEGWGRRVMTTVHSVARERGFTELVLHAQAEVEGFYRRLGYRTVGDEFEEAGIPHVEMVRSLD
ncbi:GNAT family N-acetyltransferase [Halorientalis sp.]|jgi:predicted GNAT family N-acyltransferase|uniref:GNAT family N-acetyltransferase n=1 Tax=Halorientalis sp. TaxID=1931229 RepID=UPI0026163AB4|nr:GNAT family N-acetyltransferase [Halorientalis sp.]